MASTYWPVVPLPIVYLTLVIVSVCIISLMCRRCMLCCRFNPNFQRATSRSVPVCLLTVSSETCVLRIMVSSTSSTRHLPLSAAQHRAWGAKRQNHPESSPSSAAETCSRRHPPYCQSSQREPSLQSSASPGLSVRLCGASAAARPRRERD